MFPFFSGCRRHLFGCHRPLFIRSLHVYRVICLSVPVADKSSAKRPDLVFAVFCLRSSEEYAIMKVSKAENVQGYAESGGYYIDLEVVSQDV